MDETVDIIRKRFGFYSVQRGLMYRDRILSACEMCIRDSFNTINNRNMEEFRKILYNAYDIWYQKGNRAVSYTHLDVYKRQAFGNEQPYSRSWIILSKF